MSDHVILLATANGWTDYLGPGENRWPSEDAAVAAIFDLQQNAGFGGTMIPVPVESLHNYRLLS